MKGLAIWSGGGGGSGSGSFNRTVWAATGSASSSAYANGLTYTPLRDAVSDTLAWQFIAERTGTLELAIYYAMSASQANALLLTLDVLVLSVGGNPTTALTSGTQFSVTPGNDVLMHTISSSDSGDLNFSVTAGDIVRCLLTRAGATDSHTGDMRIIEVGGT